jgi:hypothetical protein
MQHATTSKQHHHDAKDNVVVASDHDHADNGDNNSTDS